MAYFSPFHHTKQVRWEDTSSEYQVYATTTKPMPYQSNHKSRYANVDSGFNKSYDEKHALDVLRAQMMQSEYYDPQLVKITENYQVEEDVNREAEDFIALEHKKFARSKTSMPMRSE